MITDPLYYHLPSRIRLEALDNNRLGIYKVIKSRIIQKDAVKIIEISRQIKSIDSNINVTLICTRNICSKSIALLEKEGLEIQYVSE